MPHARRRYLATALALVLTTPTGFATASTTVQSTVYSTDQVTLITGDTVTYTRHAGGSPTASINPAPRPGGARVTFTMSGDGESFVVYPSDVLPYLKAGSVDRDLFDVGLMARTGLASHSYVPILVKYSDATTLSVAQLPAATPRATTHAANLVGMRVDHARAGEFWEALTANRDVGTFGHGVAKVLLDKRLRVTLDASVPMVGAPKAWAAGYDGRGVTVAVLDTGIDAAHKDLAGKVAEAKNFTDDQDAGDGHGHGTHVASTIAGTGAKYRGVAPGAMVLNGKVCDSSGSCELSAIMAGMEWAAARAQVINLSLGGAPTDGTDELSLLVDTLTAKTGALFVIAAGNSGDTAGVSTPGAASSALTVGAVDKSDRLADFSSRGPRLGDAAIKPEITAPGVRILAARASSLDGYVAHSGTSMATPHVAGAAAIIAQARPGAKAAQLKDTLVATAKDDGYQWHEQGSGRLDVARALTGISGPAAVNTGRLHQPTIRTVPYTNTTADPVRLRLSSAITGWDGSPASVMLSTKDLIVPPHGTADIGVTIDPAGRHGAFGGVVTASGDGVELRTPISWYTPYPAEPTHRLKINTLDFDGRARVSHPMVMRDTPATQLAPNDPFAAAQVFFDPDEDIDGTPVWNVPRGNYMVLSQLSDVHPERRRWAALAATNVSVQGPVTLTLDARQAVRASARTPEPVFRYSQLFSLSGNVPDLTGQPRYTGVLLFDSGDTQDIEIYALPARPARRGSVQGIENYTLGQRTLRVSVRGRELHPQFDPYLLGTRLAGDHKLPVVFAGGATPEELATVDVKGKIVLARLATPQDPGWDGFWDSVRLGEQAARNAAAAGAAAIVPYLDQPGALPIPSPTGQGPGGTIPIPTLSVTNADGERLRVQSPVDLELHVLANPTRVYNLHYSRANGIPADLTHNVDRYTLRKTQSRYHADVPGLGLNHWWLSLRTDGGGAAVGQSTWLRAPLEVEEYVGPVSGKQFWHRVMNLYDGKRAQFTLHDFEPWRGPAEDWYAGPVSIVAPDSRYHSGFFRLRSGSPDDPDLFHASPDIGDSAVGHFVNMDGARRPFSYRLFGPDGAEIRPISGIFGPTLYYPVPAQQATYRLEGTFSLPKGASGLSEAVRRLSPRVENTWIFASQRPTGTACPGIEITCEVPPLLQLRYDLALDLTNQAPAGRTHVVKVHASFGLHMSYSTDDGKTWLRGKVTSHGNGIHTVAINHPKLADTSGHVWLRTETWDRNGNRVTQTVQRAYALH